MKNLTKHSNLALALVATALLAACGGGGGGSGDVKLPNENKAPSPNAASVTAQADTAYKGKLTGTDAEMDKLTYTVLTAPTNGTLTVESDGSYSYLPNPEFTGSDSFVFRVSDGTSLSAGAAVMITVGMKEVTFSEYSRQAFGQVATANPLPLNSRNITQDVTAANAYDDLLAK